MRLKVLCVLLLTALACSGPQRTAARSGFVDCGKANKGELLGVAIELAATLWRALTTGADQKTALKAVGLKAAGKGLVVGGCAGAQFFRGLIEESAPATADGAVARSVSASAAAEALEDLRAQWGGVTWSVER